MLYEKGLETESVRTDMDRRWKRFGELLYLVSVTEFKKTYFGTVLGYVWSVLRPLLLFGVLLFVFTKIVRLGSGVPHYPVLLLMNVVLFGFFSEATTTAVMSVVNQEGVVRKTQFPRLVIPLSVVVTSLFNLGVNLVVVLIFILAFGVSPEDEDADNGQDQEAELGDASGGFHGSSPARKTRADCRGPQRFRWVGAERPAAARPR